ncbi:MAG: AbrB family transcriptional regulator [Azospirillaceae bacterium]
MTLADHLARLRLLVTALVLGSAGGWVAAMLALPLPWMLGSVIVTTTASLAGVQLGVPRKLRMSMSIVLGILLGSTFRPEMIQDVGNWFITLGGAALYAITAMVLCVLTLRRIGRYDYVTTFFSASPGSHAAMTMMGHAYGADERVIALSHSVRTVLVVVSIPLMFQLFELYDASSVDRTGDHGRMEWQDALILCACALGVFPARWMRLKAEYLLGPLMISALVHLLGFTDARPPGLVIAGAQIVIGAFVGARFVGVDLRRIWRIPAIGLILGAQMICISFLFALVLFQITDVPFPVLILALMPGGLSEMSMIAIAMQLEPAFVAFHHVVRLMVIVILAPIAFGIYQRRAAPAPADDRSAE